MSSLILDLPPVKETGEDSLLPTSNLIGTKSGEIWHYLQSCGETSILKLKAETGCSATVLHLSLGWLLREGKVQFSKKNGALTVQLK